MKKTISTITLALVMTFTATFANAGIIVGDRATPVCGAEKTGIIVFGNAADGIIVFGARAIATAVTGIIVFGKEEAPAPCTEKKPAPTRNGIIVF